MDNGISTTPKSELLIANEPTMQKRRMTVQATQMRQAGRAAQSGFTPGWRITAVGFWNFGGGKRGDYQPTYRISAGSVGLSPIPWELRERIA